MISEKPPSTSHNTTWLRTLGDCAASVMQKRAKIISLIAFGLNYLVLDIFSPIAMASRRQKDWEGGSDCGLMPFRSKEASSMKRFTISVFFIILLAIAWAVSGTSAAQSGPSGVSG